MSSLTLNHEKLENKVFNSEGGFQCMCPACAIDGKDIVNKNHLRVYSSGKFNCVVDDSVEHNKQVLSLVGVDGTGEIISPQQVQPKLDIERSWDLSILKGLIQGNNKYWQDRHISEETCNYFQIGVATKGQLCNRSILPIFNLEKTKIIGFVGRTLVNSETKYKIMGRKDSFIFGGGDYKYGGSIIFVESSADILYLFDRGIKNTLCLFGINISSKLICFIMQYNFKKILISTNNEPGNNNIGLIAAEKIKERLSQVVDSERVAIALPPAKDFCDLGTDASNLLDSWASKWFN